MIVGSVIAINPSQASDQKVFDLLLKADNLNESIPKQKDLKDRINKFQEDCRVDTAAGSMGNTTKDCQQKLATLLQELNQNSGVKPFNAGEMNLAARAKVRTQGQEQPSTPRGEGAGMSAYLERQKLILRGNPGGKSKQPGSASRTIAK